MLPNKTNTIQRKAIAYIRVSSQRQVDEGVSIQAQKRRILEYVRYKKLNLANDDIIIEEGVSGGIPLWDRPKEGSDSPTETSHWTIHGHCHDEIGQNVQAHHRRSHHD